MRYGVVLNEERIPRGLKDYLTLFVSERNGRKQKI